MDRNFELGAAVSPRVGDTRARRWAYWCTHITIAKRTIFSCNHFHQYPLHPTIHP